MNFSELKAELADRGFSQLTDTRRGTMVNLGRAELDGLFLWPYREKTASGAAPLTVSDLGPIASVQASTQNSVPLWRAGFGFLVDAYGDLTISGTAQWYYVSWTSGTPVVSVFPVSTASIAVRYWRVTPDLTGTQTPLAPSEWHGLYVDLAVKRAHLDQREYAEAAQLQQQIDNQVGQMLAALPPGQQDGPDAYVEVTGASSDW